MTRKRLFGFLSLRSTTHHNYPKYAMLSNLISNSYNFTKYIHSNTAEEKIGEKIENEVESDEELENEYAYDPSFDNLLHGVFTRKDYEKLSGREMSSVERLGRLFIYQYNCCPFCGKVKAVCDYYHIPYSLIEVSPISKKQLPSNKKFLHDRNVPILLAAKITTKQLDKSSATHKILYTSNVIIQQLMQHMCTIGQMTHSEFERSANSPIVQQWVEWIDHNLIPLLYCMLAVDKQNICKLFEYMNEFEKFKSMGVTCEPMQKMCCELFENQCLQLRAKYGITKGEEIERFLECLKEWNDITHFTFHGGTKPDVADLTCFGILRTFDNIPLVMDIIEKSGCLEWYQMVQHMIKDNSCVTHA